MITTQLILDLRRETANGYPVKLQLYRDCKRVQIALGIYLPGIDCWDSRTGNAVGKAYRGIAAQLSHSKQLVDAALRAKESEGPVSLSEGRDIALLALDPTAEKTKREHNLFAHRFKAYAETRKAPGTCELYNLTYRHMTAYDHQLKFRTFEDIGRDWLTGFERHLAQTSASQNARNIHLRNIRAVFNAAIDDEITTFYPFRRFKIRPVATIKRSLSVDQLRALFEYQVEDNVVKYVDMFKLIFCLIGINVIDLCRLREVREGRIEFYRSKTNRLYSIKVEPEAQALIDKYRGKGQLLYMLDRYASHKDYMRRLNENLRRVGKVTRSGLGGKKHYEPLFPDITSYWARHSWATIAASLDIPKETIAAALGHGGNSVTDIYIDFDRRKVDEANRRVLDWVFKSR